MTNENGVIQVKYSYDPWGNLKPTTGTLVQPFRYAGYYSDDETGLNYLKSRYYSPTLGRFLTRDAYGYIDYTKPQTMNLYSYAGNNPVSNVDPTGNWTQATDSGDWEQVDEYDDETEILVSTSYYAKKDDIKQIDDIGNKYGLDRDDWGEYVHEQKEYLGLGPAETLDWNTLNKWAKRYIEDGRKMKNSRSCFTLDNTGKVVLGGYIIYRGLRMLLSCTPATWWTAPANFACP